MLMPSVPSASAATRLRPSAMPPEAKEGDGQLFRGSRQQDEVRHVELTRVASALETVHADGVAADPLCFQRMAHRSAFIDEP